MDKVDVIWKSYHEPDVIGRGYWDQGLLEDLMAGPEYQHYTDFPGNEPEDVTERRGGIVIINGRNHVEDAEKINADIARLRWVLFIDTGDEEATFPWQDINHPLMRTWVMMPRLDQHNDISYKLPNGYRPTTHAELESIGPQSRDLDWFFAGQVNHLRREQCAEELRKLSGGLLVETHRFGDEKVPYPEYLKNMANAKIIPCPSGVESPDNFRLYEALEAGCLPIVDAYSTQHPVPGFWEYLLGKDIPFPIISQWHQLPDLLPQLLKEWPGNANRAFAWWQQKKREINKKLKSDVEALSG